MGALHTSNWSHLQWEQEHAHGAGCTTTTALRDHLSPLVLVLKTARPESGPRLRSVALHVGESRLLPRLRPVHSDKVARFRQWGLCTLQRDSTTDPHSRLYSSPLASRCAYMSCYGRTQPARPDHSTSKTCKRRPIWVGGFHRWRHSNTWKATRRSDLAASSSSRLAPSPCN